MSNSSDDEQWDGATEHDDSARMDGDDQPTMRATDDQRAAARGRALAQQLAEVGAPKSSDASDRSSRRRSTAQGLSGDRPRTPASGTPITGASADADPASTNRGMPAASRTPAASTPPTGTSDRRLPLPASRLPDQPRGSQPPPAGSIAAAAAAAADAAADLESRSTPRGDDQVILLDRVSSNAPTDSSPRRGESAAGGVVVVATGADAERIRKLCHASSLLVPVMSSLAIAHEALSVVVIGEPSPPAPDRVVHVVRPTIADDQLVDLLRSLATGYVIAEPPVATSSENEPRVVEFAQRLAKLDDRGAVEMITVEAITALVAADRAHCLFFDPSTGALWSEAMRRTLGDSRRAMGGLVGWAAYTGQTLHASPAGDDPRWLKELDDPDGKAQSRLLVQPIIGGDRRVHAVLVAARRWRHTAFTDDDVARLRRFAALVSPVLDGAAAGEGWKRRPSATLPGPLAAAAGVSSGGTAASRQSALVGAPSRPPTNPPPLTASKAPTNPPPVATNRPPVAATRPPTNPPPVPTGAAPRSPTGPAQAIQAVAPTNPPVAARRPSTDPPPPPKRATTDRGTGAPGAAPIESTPTSWSGVWSATNPPAADVPASMRDDLEDSRPFRPLTKRPPATSNTGRTKVPTGERVSSRRGVRSNRKVAIVAADDEHDRMKRVSRTCGLELAITSSTDAAPADARIVTIGQAWSPDLDPRVVYVARTSISDDALADLLTAVASGMALVAPATVGKPSNPLEARRAQIAFTGSRSFASALDLAAAETGAISTVRELLDADRAYLLIYNEADGSLRSPSRVGRGDDRRAIAGIAGWVAHTGCTVTADRAVADPRWLAPIDDPDGDPNSQLLVQPVVGADQRVLAVIVAAKRPRRPGFTELDGSLAARFAALVAPLLQQLQLHVESQQLLGDTTGARDPLLPRSPIEQLLDRVRGLPRWAFAVAGVVLLVLILLIARC